MIFDTTQHVEGNNKLTVYLTFLNIDSVVNIIYIIVIVNNDWQLYKN